MADPLSSPLTLVSILVALTNAALLVACWRLPAHGAHEPWHPCLERSPAPPA